MIDKLEETQLMKPIKYNNNILQHNKLYQKSITKDLKQELNLTIALVTNISILLEEMISGNRDKQSMLDILMLYIKEILK